MTSPFSLIHLPVTSKNISVYSSLTLLVKDEYASKLMRRLDKRYKSLKSEI